MPTSFDHQPLQAIDSEQKVKSRKLDLKQIYYDLQSLDSQNYGSWPIMVRYGVILIVVLLIALISYMLPIRSQFQQIEAQINQQQVLLATYHSNYKQVNQLQSHLVQEEIRQQQQQRLTKLLPNVDSGVLLQKLNDLGMSSGVKIEDLRVDPEVINTFYSEQPIRFKAVGTYDQIGLFIGGLSALSRLITMHDLDVTVVKPTNFAQSKSPTLMLTLDIKAYQAMAQPQNQLHDQTPTSGTTTKPKD